MGYWDILVRTLWAFVVVLSAALGTISGRIDTVTELAAVWILVADVTVFITATTPTRQVVKVCIKLVLRSLAPLRVNTAVLAFITDVTTTFAEAIHILGITSSANLSKTLVV
jgi:hypothetical protein